MLQQTMCVWTCTGGLTLPETKTLRQTLLHCSMGIWRVMHAGQQGILLAHS